MIFKRYESKGLAHYSYLIGDQGDAVVIDPRRDIDAYLTDAASGGYQISKVLETHRNEDYVVGSTEIAAATSADLFHADAQWDYQYGAPVVDGQEWEVGRLKLTAIHTPGHTPGSMSYLLHDSDGHPWIVFTGDAVFSGEVGRMDLLGEDRLEEMAGLLYESLFEKLLPLGDQVIVCPAHGAGSVCGSEIAERTWTTIGLERQFNPKLQVDDKHEFVAKFAKMLERPPYFRKMEKLNLEGAPVLGRLPDLTPLSPGALGERMEEAQVVDTRDQISFGGGHLRDSLCMWRDILASFAGWFFDYDQPLLFVTNGENNEGIVRTMVRLGFDNLGGYLTGGPVAWSKSGRALESIRMLSVDSFCQEIKTGGSRFLLDVRGEDELTGEGLRLAKRIHLTKLPDHLDDIPRDESVYIVCSSGFRSIIAASYLKRKGWQDLRVLIGGLEAWENFGCEFEL